MIYKKFIKDFKRYSKNIVHVTKKYWGSRKDENYHFSMNDVFLYWCERNRKCIPIDILQEEDTVYKLCINNIEFFWPKKFNIDDLPWLFSEVFYNSKYNPSSYNHPYAVIPQNGWVIDGGACEGFFSIFAFQNGAKQVIAVEPISLLRPVLEKTFSKEYLQGRFTMITAGLGKEGGTSVLHLNPLSACEAYISDVNNESKRIIKIVTIDEIIEVYNLEGPGLIKMDIEGAEVDALKGAKDTLRNLKPNLAIAVYHEYENALECAEIIKNVNPDYKIQFRGMYGWFNGKPRPYILFAY